MEFKPEKRIETWSGGETLRTDAGILKEFRHILIVVLLMGILAANIATANNYIQSVSHEIVGDDEIKITVIIKNPDEEVHYFRVKLVRASDGKVIAYKTGSEDGELEIGPWYEGFPVGVEETGIKILPGKTYTTTFSSNWNPWDINTLEGAYAIRLEEKDLGVVDQTDIINVVPPGGPVACSCNCHGTLIESPVGEEEYGNCPELCSKQCAGFADCRADCANCCRDYCQGAGLPAEGIDACKKACEDTCRFNSTTYGLIDAVRTIALAIAALAIAVFGLKFLISEDIESRQEAKRYLMYIISALILLGIAQGLVGLFYKPPALPTAPPMPTTNIHIAEIGNAVVSCWDNSGGQNRVCKKIDVSGWQTYTVTEDDVRRYLDSIGRDDVKDRMNWKISANIDRTLGGKVCIRYDTSFINEVFVVKEDQDALCSR